MLIMMDHIISLGCASVLDLLKITLQIRKISIQTPLLNFYWLNLGKLSVNSTIVFICQV